MTFLGRKKVPQCILAETVPKNEAKTKKTVGPPCLQVSTPSKKCISFSCVIYSAVSCMAELEKEKYNRILLFGLNSRSVRSLYQTCAEMLSLHRTPIEQLKWTSKREKSTVKAARKMRGVCPVAGASRILFLTVFLIDILRFEVHLSCFVGVLRRDSISADPFGMGHELI